MSDTGKPEVVNPNPTPTKNENPPTPPTTPVVDSGIKIEELDSFKKLTEKRLKDIQEVLEDIQNNQQPKNNNNQPITLEKLKEQIEKNFKESK